MIFENIELNLLAAPVGRSRLQLISDAFAVAIAMVFVEVGGFGKRGDAQRFDHGLAVIYDPGEGRAC